MTIETDDSTTTAAPSEKTFTRAEVRQMIGAEVRKVRDQYADYDDLKAKADAAAASESKLDKLVTQVEALTTRAEKAETENLRRGIADEFGLTAREARRLSGKTADELRADAEEMVEDLGIDVKARKAGKAGTTAPKGEATDGEIEGGETAQQDDEETPATSQQTPPAARMRPRENLRSGAPRTETKPEETNPLKLVADIPRR